MKIDKQHGNIAFNEEFHKYFNIKNPEYQYTSVTTLIGKYHDQFDSEFFSKYKALERILQEDFLEHKRFLLDRKKKFKLKDWKAFIESIDLNWKEFQEEYEGILAEWKATNLEACERGTAFHLDRELEWYDRYNTLVKQRLPVTGDFYCKQGSFELDKEKAVVPEFLVYYSSPDGILHMAGQVDLLIKDGNDIYILDYKTNAKGIKDKAFFDVKKKKTVRMHYPIANIEDTTLNHYTLQLSIYAFMLKKLRPEFNIKMLKLIHIAPDNTETEIEVPYLEKDVMNLMAHYKKVLQIEKERSEYGVL